MYKHLYSHFLKANTGHLHFASHSHHFWPDVTREAHLQYWDDSAKYVDHKWEYIFSKKIPAAQKLIAENLNISQPEQLVFAPNTHEFVFRLVSSLDWKKKIRILTTDSEFYSFDRQIKRLSELGSFEIVKVPTLPFATFHERFEAELTKNSWDMIFVSHVFFNSGCVCDFSRFVAKASEETLFVVDGYHGFMALPTDFKSCEQKAFYVAGSYKYAQGGEGACFLYVPPKTKHRPFYTGWFAELSHLSAVGNEVGYPTDALQYAGSTMDFSALYRLSATLNILKNENLSVEKIHRFIQDNQNFLLSELKKNPHALVNEERLMNKESSNRGHFLTFELPDTATTIKLVEALKNKGVLVDSRENRFRIGFGLYHDHEDLKGFVKTLQAL